MFQDRTEAGEKLAQELATLELTDPVVLALPRGGVPVALPVAKRLGAPGNAELAAGAVVDGPAHAVVFNADVLRMVGRSEADFDAAIATKLAEIEARRTKWLKGRAPVAVAGRSVIVVDDGIATGATVRAGLKGLSGRGAKEVILAVPVAPAETLDELAALTDRIVCLETPAAFYAVGAHYAKFEQVADETVTALMNPTDGDEK